MLEVSVKDMVADWAKVGTMLLVSRWLTGGSLMDRSWQQSSLYTLLGFSAYQVVTRSLTPVGLTGAAKMVADDVLKVGTVMIVSRLLSGGNLSDRNWIMASLASLAGFIVYDIIVAKYVHGADVIGYAPAQTAVDDLVKVGTMLVVSRLISRQPLQDPAWMMSSLSVLAGFAAYDLVVSQVVEKLLG